MAASADWAEIAERHRLSAIATIARAVRVALEALGIDPGCAARLREAATAEAALAALPDPPELWQTDDDAAAHPGDADSDALDAFRAETERLAGATRAIAQSISPPRRSPIFSPGALLRARSRCSRIPAKICC